jgi:hypothetical protein
MADDNKVLMVKHTPIGNLFNETAQIAPLLKT